MNQKTIGKDAAIALYEAKWWEGRTAREIAEFQFSVAELCCPFDVLQKAVETALDRPVFTHEFAFVEELYKELMGEREAPSFQEILDLIPEEKRIVVVVENELQNLVN